MIRRSNDSKVKLITAIGDRVQAFQDATDEMDEAVAERLRINRTDLRCLSVVARTGSIAAGELAEAAGLTRGAMTTALDRLEAAGYVRRIRDQQDRRSVRLEMPESARQEIDRLYGPIAVQGGRMLQAFTAAELAAVLRYLESGRDLQRAHARRIRELAFEGRAPRR